MDVWHQAKADLQVVNLITDESCDPECTQPYLANDGVSAVFAYYGDAYCGGGGAMSWTADK